MDQTDFATKNAKSLGDKILHPLFALQSAPGGKLFFFDELASLKGHYYKGQQRRMALSILITNGPDKMKEGASILNGRFKLFLLYFKMFQYLFACKGLYFLGLLFRKINVGDQLKDG
ncbi:hypothetical protein RhiirA1_387579 [Rhizophagus irregularis]|uniref:Uncharacterized protein n=1 Tax=Rhizophagus irregularis TaxID=588596 RepID=A0A2N0SHU1_9GLOM|nr:hypothetical protein RhiirA1_387579 [Rhizophagus irregularis]